MTQPSLLVAERVRHRLRLEQIDPAAAPGESLRIAQDEVRRHNDVTLARGGAMIDDEAGCVRDVLAAVSGFGALQPLLDDPTIEEIWLNSPEHVFVARGGVAERTGLRLTEAVVRDLVERMLHSSGRRVDLSQPFVDASLPDGSRLHVAIADVVRGSWAVNIRKFLPQYRTLDALVAQGALPADLAHTLAEAMREGKSILVSGATHAGKTTMLSALLASCAATQRIVTAEETFELAFEAADLVALQGRQASLEGTGEITLRRLVKEALRMRPDRLVIGEVRDAEALDLVLALNTGVPGLPRSTPTPRPRRSTSSPCFRSWRGATSTARSSPPRSRCPCPMSSIARAIRAVRVASRRFWRRPGRSPAAGSAPGRCIARPVRAEEASASDDSPDRCDARRRRAPDRVTVVVARR
ncbi:CpaF family protein [Microbacterium sp. NIBRBAC000506063]|uniref:CpaF family protein n=1 Tax=Microbacterium sp. NIBRBAC000506063 TaxID=2734618 RepID=UPI002948C364|nr:ATPase, T2SS/T4P/T4SS family [Microbacterium sp. NIBRBAC000506063]